MGRLFLLFKQNSDIILLHSRVLRLQRRHPSPGGRQWFWYMQGRLCRRWCSESRIPIYRGSTQISGWFIYIYIYDIYIIDIANNSGMIKMPSQTVATYFISFWAGDEKWEMLVIIGSRHGFLPIQCRGAKWWSFGSGIKMWMTNNSVNLHMQWFSVTSILFCKIPDTVAMSRCKKVAFSHRRCKCIFCVCHNNFFKLMQ